MTVRRVFLFLGISHVIAVVLLARQWPWVHWAWLVLAPLLLIGFYDLLQKKHTILRLYPIIGHFRYMFEGVRDEMQQYFVESNTDGMPISREFRSLAYQRGEFDAGLFSENARRDVVKMIELKLSQGAKPGHGGVLPAAKLTREIANIRHVPMGEDVISPPAHSAFSTPTGLLEFVQQLRELSGGKSVGFKLCVGDKREFLSICKAMQETGIVPDFITVDGAEGGTGAAPVELTNSVGMPLRGALHFVHNALLGIGVRDQLRIIAAGKVFSAFHMIRLMALGADTVNQARGMMLALVELLNILGLCGLEEVRPRHINRRINQEVVMSYEQIYPCIRNGCLLDEASVPDDWKQDWEFASAASWR